MTIFKQQASAEQERKNCERRFGRPHFIVPCQNGYGVSDREVKDDDSAVDSSSSLIALLLALRGVARRT